MFALLAGRAGFARGNPITSLATQAGRQNFVKFYRRLYEGQNVMQDQMLAMIEPTTERLVTVLEKSRQESKPPLPTSGMPPCVRGRIEGTAERGRRSLFAMKAIGFEEYRTALLTYVKMKNEHISKQQAVKLARIEKDQADIELRMHEIRAVLPYKHATIKTIVRQRGFSVKQLDPVIVVQNLERLQAEALIETQYLARLKSKAKLTATIEPTILESRCFPGAAMPAMSPAWRFPGT